MTKEQLFFRRSLSIRSISSMVVSMVVSNIKRKLLRKHKDDHVSNYSEFSVFGFDFAIALLLM